MPPRDQPVGHRPPASAPADAGARPLVSVVVPSLNQGRFLEAALRSLLDQGYESLEILVVDGGSTDESLDVLRRLEGGPLSFTSELDAGQSDALNKGFTRAQGAILSYLNSDDLLLPGAVEAAVAALASAPGPAVVYGDQDVIDADGAFLYRQAAPLLTHRRMVFRGAYVTQAGSFWSRAVHEDLGGFDLGLRYAMDQDFFVRAASRFPLLRLPRTQAAFRYHGTSKTSADAEAMWREGLLVSERYGLGPWHAWYWIRRLRHRGLRLLPRPLQARVLRLAGRADAALLERPARSR